MATLSVSGKMYGNANACAFKKMIDWVNDDIRLLLTTSSYTPNQDTHVYKDVSITSGECTASVGYTAGGIALSGKDVTYDSATNKTKLVATNVNIATLTLTTNAWYMVVYDNTPASSKPLIAYIDLTDNQPCDGNFTITWNADGVCTLTAS
jgi:hypothetical protein